MKKIAKWLLIASVLVFAFVALVACGKEVDFSINFIVDGEQYATVSTAGNETITMPENPTKGSYSFDGWYWDKDIWNTPFTTNSLLDTPLSSDMSVYAKFTHNHDDSDWEIVSTVASTEETEGSITYSCTVCGATKTEIIERLPHVHVYSEEWKKDEAHHWHECAKDGDKSGYALHEWNSGTITKEATEDETGTKLYTCTVCGATKTETIERLPHVHVYSEEWEKNETHHWHECAKDGDKSGYALHEWNSGTITKEATEDETGTKLFTCTVCGATKTEPVDKLPHTHKYSDVWTKDETYHWHSATCGHDSIFEKSKHIFENWIINREATEQEEGEKYRVCQKCGYKEIQIISIPTYKISFDLNGGTTTHTTDPIIVTSLNASDLFFDIKKENYSFCGWSYLGTRVFDENGIKINEVLMEKDMMLLAEFDQKIKLTISTNIPEAGIISEGGEYEYNSDVDIFARPNMGYKFVGWRYQNVTISEQENYNFRMWNQDVELVAVFKCADFKLNISSNHKDKGLIQINPSILNIYQVSAEKEIAYKSSVTIVAFSQTETRFFGWFDENNNLVSTNASYTFIMPNYDYSLVAKWGYFTIEYNLDGGINNFDNPVGYFIGDEIQLFPPTKLSYTFDGWYLDDEFVNKFTTLDGMDYDITLYAKWTYYTLTTNTNLSGAGTYTSKNQVKTNAGSEVTLTATTNNGYTWLGWYDGETKVSEGTSLTYTFNMPAENKTYTAKWTYYTLTTNTNLSGAGTYTSKNQVKTTAGSEVTLTATTNNGYTWLGWYDGETKVSEGTSLTYTFDMPAESKTYTAKWEVKAEMALFDFAFTPTTCTITGIKNKSVKKIIVPDYVTNINSGAFSGCSSLQSITIPFVGNRAGVTSSDTYQYPFGYIFGTSSYTGGTETTQYYYGSSTTSITDTTYYIPSTLKSVTITGGYIPYGAFYNCSSLTSITLPDSVTSIGDDAFDGCSSLQYNEYDNGYYLGNDNNPYIILVKAKNTSITSCTIHEDTKFIYDDAFYNCRSLQYNEYDNGYYLGNDNNPYIILVKARYTNITSCTIHENTKFIHSGAFDECYRLTSVYYTGDIASWCGITFGNDYSNPLRYAHNLYINNEIISGEIVLPNTVTQIPSYTFKNSQITSITIPDSVTSIGEEAFSGCTATIVLGKNPAITTIGSYAFSGYNGTSITIPNSVTSIGDWAFAFCNSLQYNEYDNGYYLGNDNNPYMLLVKAKDTSITSCTIHENTKFIHSDAFSHCRSLTSITIPDSVTSIGEGAFLDCYHLVEVYNKSSLNITKGSTENGFVGYFAKAIYTEEYTSKLLTDSNGYVIYTDGEEKSLIMYTGEETELTLPEGITEINQGAFYGNNKITSITIPDSVTSIGDNAFYNCSSLTSITLGNSVTSIGYSAFSGCTSTIAWGKNPAITTIGTYAFSGYKGTSITIPDSVTSIGAQAFYNCYSLTSITIPVSVTSIEDSAFSGCSSLQSITIPFVGSRAGVTSGDTYQYPFGYIFGTSSYTGGTETTQYYYGSSTTSTTNTTYYIPSTLKSVTVTGGYIPYGAFYNCSSLTSVTIGNGVTSIGYSAFYKCSSLTSITIPDSVTSIGTNAFCGCSILTSITIPDRVTSIGDSAFDNCSSLTSITIPDSVTSIGNYVFCGCSRLTSITIPDNVTSIGNYAFYYCDSLMNITFQGTKEEWNAISKGSSWNYNTGSYTVYCTDGTLNK